MDQFDKSILFQLAVNYRASYQTIAKRLNLSINAIKKRIQKLKDEGVIMGGLLVPLNAMLGMEDWMAILKTDDPMPSDALLDSLGAHPLVLAASIMTDGSILCYGNYAGAQGLEVIGTFLRNIPGVESVEFHTILSEPGKKQELTLSDLKVLRCLRQDPRMSISDLKEKTRLTSRRIRKIIRELLGENGSEPSNYIEWDSLGGSLAREVSFKINVQWDLNAGGHTAFFIIIRHKEGVEYRSKIVSVLKEQFPVKFWYAIASAFEPVFFSVFVVEHMRETSEILDTLRNTPEVISAYAIYGYPGKAFHGPIDDYFEQLFKRFEIDK
ncbi:MAG: winged helix-turn-helix transcriptional regulator [Candidatus Thorarchaeota archaeon]